MSDRTELLPENELVRRIKSSQLVRDELKGAGQGFGSDSLVTERIFSDDPYDIEVNGIGFDDRIVEVVFTPTYENSSYVYQLYVDSSLPAGEPIISTYTERERADAAGVQRWRFYLVGLDSNPTDGLWMKFYFYASGSGTFTTTLI